ncbi:zinc finger CCCH domain-containing protein 45 [Canna indica]|uniref:Zinc finger CCCH domain-containing protein 45 n=1 Tax=Canna indica TaxID=4628 RepID=A0AAQ3L6H4_9LILI|nr:zinc finger CCCH domain-containing protein 45 [Canna indica]
MEDHDGALSFDFEGGLNAAPSAAGPSAAGGPLELPDPTAAAVSTRTAAPSGAPYPTPGSGVGNFPGRRSFRQTVCRHWLRGLCMKGDVCGFLHQYDKDRMPVCRFFRLYGSCREQDCVYKHTSEDIKECNMYKLGFCPNGPNCRYRHAKLPGPPPPVEEVLQKIQHLSSFGYGSSKFHQHRKSSYNQQPDKNTLLSASGLPNQNTVAIPASSFESSIVNQPHSLVQQYQKQQQQQLPSPPQPASENQVPGIANGLSNQAIRSTSPLPQGQSRCVWSF